MTEGVAVAAIAARPCGDLIPWADAHGYMLTPPSRLIFRPVVLSAPNHVKTYRSQRSRHPSLGTRQARLASIVASPGGESSDRGVFAFDDAAQIQQA